MQASRRPGPLGRAWLPAGLAVTLALPVACAVWLYVLPVDPAPYLATIEGLSVPSSWEVIHTQILRDPMMGPRVDRYYLVDAEPPAIAPVVQDVLRSAGLEIYDQVADSDWCDSRPIGATPAISCPRKEIPTCSENGPGGPISCRVQAFHWLSMASSLETSMIERLYVSVSARRDVFEVGVNDQRHLVEASNRALVVISADKTTARSFWSSPTPLASATPH
jgi:hypothetical protein